MASSGAYNQELMSLRIRELLYSQLISQAIQTFCELDLPDQLPLTGKGISLKQLAKKTNTNPIALERLLNALKQFSLVEDRDGGFLLSSLGRTLMSNSFASAQYSALLVHGEMGVAWRGLSETIRSGESSFENHYGTSLFDYFEKNPTRRAIFDNSQNMGLDLEIPYLLANLELGNEETIVDVGGGSGHLLMHLLEKWPNSNGILVDLPIATEIAQKYLQELGKPDCFEVEVGDFFQSLPTKGTVYLLSHVLHDWSDEDCKKILATCRRCMPDSAQLVIVDLVIKDNVSQEADTTAAMMDLYMLSLFGTDGGRERRESEFRRLIEESGFMVEKIKTLPGGNGIIYAWPR